MCFYGNIYGFFSVPPFGKISKNFFTDIQSLTQLNEGILRCASFQYDITTESTQYGGWNYGEKSFLNDINKLGCEIVFAIIPVIVTPGNGINIPQNVGLRGMAVYLQSSSLIKATVKVYVLYH